ncbi:MAG: hypothetical protein V4692_01610, partial [Bdellovibrionota bacterium]
MKNTVFILMTLLALPAVAETETLKHNANFFANSLRRDADQEEASSIVRTGNGCTGFFVANKNNRLLVASARHCFDYQATTNCASGSIHLVTARGTHALTCSSLVVSRADNDMFIMEVKPDSVGVDAVLKDISFLKLSAKKPADGQRL